MRRVATSVNNTVQLQVGLKAEALPGAVQRKPLSRRVSLHVKQDLPADLWRGNQIPRRAVHA